MEKLDTLKGWIVKAHKYWQAYFYEALFYGFGFSILTVSLIDLIFGLTLPVWASPFLLWVGWVIGWHLTDVRKIDKPYIDKNTA